MAYVEMSFNSKGREVLVKVLREISPVLESHCELYNLNDKELKAYKSAVGYIINYDEVIWDLNEYQAIVKVLITYYPFIYNMFYLNQDEMDHLRNVIIEIAKYLL